MFYSEPSFLKSGLFKSVNLNCVTSVSYFFPHLDPQGCFNHTDALHSYFLDRKKKRPLFVIEENMNIFSKIMFNDSIKTIHTVLRNSVWYKNQICASPFDYCLQALLVVHVGSVNVNEPNTGMRQSDMLCWGLFLPNQKHTEKYQWNAKSSTCLPILSSTTLSQLFLARVNFLLSSSSIVW